MTQRSARMDDSAAARAVLDARLREVVADQLGTDVPVLTSDVSLVDDLAADSLDLAEMGLAIEAEIGLPVPLRRLDRVRTFGDLLATVHELCDRTPRPVPLGRSRLMRAGASLPSVERAGALTPYALELLVEDTRCAGPGARLDLVVDAGTPGAELVRLRHHLESKIARNVQVHVRRSRPGRVPGRSVPPPAASTLAPRP